MAERAAGRTGRAPLCRPRTSRGRGASQCPRRRCGRSCARRPPTGCARAQSLRAVAGALEQRGCACSRWGAEGDKGATGWGGGLRRVSHARGCGMALPGTRAQARAPRGIRRAEGAAACPPPHPQPRLQRPAPAEAGAVEEQCRTLQTKPRRLERSDLTRTFSSCPGGEEMAGSTGGTVLETVSQEGARSPSHHKADPQRPASKSGVARRGKKTKREAACAAARAAPRPP